MKRTTSAIDDGILRRLKKKGQTQPTNRNYRLKLHGWVAREQAGVDLLDREKLFDLMNGR